MATRWIERESSSSYRPATTQTRRSCDRLIYLRYMVSWREPSLASLGSSPWEHSLLHYLELAPELKRLGFNALPADNCMFMHESIAMATSLFVDDGLLVCPSLAHAERVLGPMGLGRKRKITWGR